MTELEINSIHVLYLQVQVTFINFYHLHLIVLLHIDTLISVVRINGGKPVTHAYMHICIWHPKLILCYFLGIMQITLLCIAKKALFKQTENAVHIAIL